MLRRYQGDYGGSKHERMKQPRPRPCEEKRNRGQQSHNRDGQRPDASAARATSSKVSGSRPVTSRTVVETTSISPRAIDV